MKLKRSYYSKTTLFFTLLWLFAPAISPGQQTTLNYENYHKPDEINTLFAKLAKQYNQVTRVHDLAVSPGKRDLIILEIGNKINSAGKKAPAVFVAGNMEGTVPISSEASLFLADLILSDQSNYKNLTWYILPCGNPDAAMHFFERPLVMDQRNDMEHNDDMDELTDEDGYIDLNKDGLMKFITEHHEIAATFTFGSTNFCLVPPKGGRRGSVDMDKIKIPERFAEMFDADPDISYKISEIIEMVQPMVPEGMEVTESMVAGFLGLGAVVNPMKEDLVFYKELSEKYKEYLKEKGAEFDRFDPEPAKDGSFELWSYYHLGIPTFSMDFWTLPKVKEKKEIDKNLFRVRIRLVNGKAIPSMSYHSVQNKLYPKDILKLSGKGIKVVSGGKLTDQYRNKVNYKEYKPEIQFCQVPGFGEVEYQFLVSGKGDLIMEYES